MIKNGSSVYNTENGDFLECVDWLERVKGTLKTVESLNNVIRH